jgi:hypothetical protein
MVVDVISLEPTMLTDYSEFIGIQDSDPSEAIQNIQEIVPIPGVGNSEFQRRHGPLEKIPNEESVQAGVLNVYCRRIDAAVCCIDIITKYRELGYHELTPRI